MLSSSEYWPDTPHSLALEERHGLCVSWVCQVLSFDEEQMDTSLGLLTVEGEGLHVEKLTLDAGELTLEGSIQSLSYSREGKRKGSFWSRVF